MTRRNILFGITQLGIELRRMPKRIRSKTRFSYKYLRFLNLLRRTRINAGLYTNRRGQTTPARKIPSSSIELQRGYNLLENQPQ